MRYAIFPALVLASTFALSVATEAKEWKRQSTVTTPRGTYSSQAQGSCADGACTRAGSTTGPNGKTVTSSGAVNKTDTGAAYTREVTGPNGGTVTRSGTITRTPPAN